MKLLVYVFVLVAVVMVSAGDDFYELLGVDRSATSREIRKAFKKVALEKHPDKNPNDPDAHDKFLRINRAYEVLKDEDLRKKYDTHGEAGLKEDGPTGQGYKSWKFYQHEFGIYDNDEEIITLSKSDFEQSVDSTDDIWFINFYSPQCSHCHTLAPSWREVARELEGVIRIGAVNCGDDWSTCRQQRIQSYPSLIMYPQREKYGGSKTTRELVKFALKQVRAQVSELWSGNFDSTITDEEKINKPWLISFCGEGGDCVEHMTVTKLAAMLDELVNVGELHCHSNQQVCDRLGVSYGTYYYDAGKVEKGAGVSISSLDAKEIASTVLHHLPEVTELDDKAYGDALNDLSSGTGTAWLMIYSNGELLDLEMKKLPALLSEMNIGHIDCSKMKEACDKLHITKFPAFTVRKKGDTDNYEFHHGRQTAHDVAAFARLSAEGRVQTLGPADFPDRVVDNKDPWIVDYFAPWCPPCMRLLPEFRKASKMMQNINFGTVDCTVHSSICDKYNVHSYPTTIFYNMSVPHQFHGHHTMQSIVEFVEDTLAPPVIVFDPTSFEKLVTKKGKDDIWLVDFFAPWCGPCQQLAPEWRRLAKMVKDIERIHVGQVDCQAHKSLCQDQGVRNYPNIRLYPTGQNNKRFHQFNGWFRDAQSLRAWAFEYLPSKVVDLSWKKFQEILSGKDPWIIDFFAPWCGHCQVFAPEFEKVAQSMEGLVKAGKVDCDRNEYLCEQADIGAYPTVRFYKGAGNQAKTNMYGEEVDSMEASHIIKYLKRKVANTKSTPKKLSSSKTKKRAKAVKKKKSAKGKAKANKKKTNTTKKNAKPVIRENKATKEKVKAEKSQAKEMKKEESVPKVTVAQRAVNSSQKTRKDEL